MNNTFEWNRFKKVVRKDFNNMLHQYSTYLFLSDAPAVIWLSFWVLNGLSENFGCIIPDVRLGLIILLSYLTSLLTPSILFKTMNQPKEGIYFAMLPASKLEKYLSILLFTIVICPLAVLGCSLVIDLLLTILPFGPYKEFFWQTAVGRELSSNWSIFANSDFVKAVPLMGKPGNILLLILLSILNYDISFVLGATFFKKHKFLLTILWWWIISFALQLIATPIFGALVFSEPEWFTNLIDTNPNRVVNFAFYFGIIFNIIYLAVFTWWAGYRLKRMSY